MHDLAGLLQLAAAWIEREQDRIGREGRPLNADELALARAAGVCHPERVRIQIVETIPYPAGELLYSIGRQMALISPEHANGQALGYGISLRTDVAGDAYILAHELVHTAQYERFGSPLAFLAEYIRQVQAQGYPAADLEQEAIRIGRRISKA